MKFFPPPLHQPYVYANGIWRTQAFGYNNKFFMVYKYGKASDGLGQIDEYSGNFPHGARPEDLSEEIRTACELWCKNNMGMPICEFLESMLGDSDTTKP